MGDIVFMDDDYAIIREDRPFSIGFNVYRLGPTDNKGLASGTKINDLGSWFKTEDAALDWLEKHRAAAIH